MMHQPKPSKQVEIEVSHEILEIWNPPRLTLTCQDEPNRQYRFEKLPPGNIWEYLGILVNSQARGATFEICIQFTVQQVFWVVVA